MNTQNQISILSISPDITFSLGKAIGENILPGTIIALTGDLGAGKTAFVKGLARGLGVPDNYPITSPTYTLINEYPGKYPFFHVDLYRLENKVDFEDIGLYDMLDEHSVAAIEWADRLDSAILAKALQIHIEFADDHSRLLHITASASDSDHFRSCGVFNINLFQNQG